MPTKTSKQQRRADPYFDGKYFITIPEHEILVDPIEPEPKTPEQPSVPPSEQPPSTENLPRLSTIGTQTSVANTYYLCQWREAYQKITLCDKAYESIEALTKHVVDDHVMPQANGFYWCNWKNCWLKPFKNHLDLAKHVAIHTKVDAACGQVAMKEEIAKEEKPELNIEPVEYVAQLENELPNLMLDGLTEVVDGIGSKFLNVLEHIGIYVPTGTSESDVRNGHSKFFK